MGKNQNKYADKYITGDETVHRACEDDPFVIGLKY